MNRQDSQSLSQLSPKHTHRRSCSNSRVAGRHPNGRVFVALALAMLLELAARAQPGSLDITFNPGTGANGEVRCVSLFTNGQVLIGGNFGFINGVPRNRVARLNPNGDLDTSFDPLVGPDGIIFAAVAEPEGTALIGGSFRNINSIRRMYLARLRKDASLDLGFPNIVFDDQINYIERQSDGQYLVIGDFQTVDGIPRKNVALVRTNGTLVASFNPASRTTNGAVLTAAIQPDGKVLLAGSFRAMDDTNRTLVVRVSANGALDESFNAGYIGGSVIRKVALDPDGRVVVAGDFTSVDGYSRPNIARLGLNGTLDTGFSPPPGIGPTFYAMHIQPDGKCILGGSLNYRDLVRLNTNGTLDVSFNAQAGGTVHSMAVQFDLQIVIAGDFQSIGPTNINRIARLNGDGAAPPENRLMDVAFYRGFSLSGVIGSTYRVEYAAALATGGLWTPLTNIVLLSNPTLVIDPQQPGRATRFYRAVRLPD